MGILPMVSGPRAGTPVPLSAKSSRVAWASCPWFPDHGRGRPCHFRPSPAEWHGHLAHGFQTTGGTPVPLSAKSSRVAWASCPWFPDHGRGRPCHFRPSPAEWHGHLAHGFQTTGGTPVPLSAKSAEWHGHLAHGFQTTGGTPVPLSAKSAIHRQSGASSSIMKTMLVYAPTSIRQATAVSTFALGALPSAPFPP